MTDMTEADTTELTDAETTVEQDVLEDAAPAKTEDLEERLVAEGEIAGDYLEELLDLLDFDGDIDLDVEGNRAVVSIDGGDGPGEAGRPQGRGARCTAGADPAGGPPEDGRTQPADAGHRAAGAGAGARSWRRWASKIARRVLETRRA